MWVSDSFCSTDASGSSTADLQPQWRIQTSEAQDAGVVLLLLGCVQAAENLITQPAFGLLKHLHGHTMYQQEGTGVVPLAGFLAPSHGCRSPPSQLDIQHDT